MNIGYTALLAHSLGCHVEGVEASPKTYAFLIENIRRNSAEKFITAHHAAVSRHSKRGSTVAFRNDRTGLTNFVDLKGSGRNNSALVYVPTIQSIAVNTSPPPIFMKIDVEGFEYSALLTVKHLLGRIPIILFEWYPARMQERDGDESAGMFLGTLRRTGYTLLHYNGQRATDEELLAPGFAEGDVFAILSTFKVRKFVREVTAFHSRMLQATRNH